MGGTKTDSHETRQVGGRALPRDGSVVQPNGVIHRVQTPRVPIEVGTVVILRKRDSGMEFPAIVVAIVGSGGLRLQWFRQDGQGRGLELNKPTRLDGKRHTIVGVYFDSAPRATALRWKAGFDGA